MSQRNADSKELLEVEKELSEELKSRSIQKDRLLDVSSKSEEKSARQGKTKVTPMGNPNEEAKISPHSTGGKKPPMVIFAPIHTNAADLSGNRTRPNADRRSPRNESFAEVT